jgi:metal-responsive CopG/Arc/MetJ family transcriptional regulator
MGSIKIAITLDEDLLGRVDELVARSVFPNRSRAIQAAVAEKLERLQRNRLATECAKLDAAAEGKLADAGLGRDLESWPEY